MYIWAVYSRGQDHKLTYSETLYCGVTSKHTCCSVPAARWGVAMGGGMDQGVEGAVV